MGVARADFRAAQRTDEATAPPATDPTHTERP